MAALVGSLRARWREGSALSVSGLSQQLQRTLVLANANLLRQGSLLDKKKKSLKRTCQEQFIYNNGLTKAKVSVAHLIKCIDWK
jgi:hypothetical protein